MPSSKEWITLPVEVEAVFGQMKSNNRFTRFTMKGLGKGAVEFGLMATAHNLRKWAKKWAKDVLFGNGYNDKILYTIKIAVRIAKIKKYRLIA